MVNYTKSLAHLGTTVEKESLNKIEKAGLIQFFEVAFELSWKVMKDYLITEGYDVKSPREAIKTAFDYGLIADGANGSKHSKNGTSPPTPMMSRSSTNSKN
jgi:nucleotidyltransferase substrate binding protein (TIGR01987 family)